MSNSLKLVEKKELPMTEKVNLALLDLDGLPNDLPKEEVRLLIAELEEVLKLTPQIELPVKHYFSKGVYGRELLIPKGMLLTGKIHIHQTMNVLSHGEVTVFSVDGLMRIKAPYTYVSSPGAKRIFYAHEDTLWTNFHGTEETDVDKIMEQFTTNDYAQVVEHIIDISVIEKE